MDIGELKKMLKNSTAVLIMDNGEPSFVVVNYDSYRELIDQGEKEIKVKKNNIEGFPKPPAPIEPPTGRQDIELLERINKDILALKAQIEDEEKALGVD